MVYLRLAANPRDGLAMRRAINTPARGIGAKTEMALKVLVGEAQNAPGLESIIGPECLMSLLDDQDLDELEAALIVGSDAEGTGVADMSEGALGGGAATWAEEQGGMPIVSAVGGSGQGTGEGWRGFSVARARRLGRALEAGAVEGPTRAQANKLRIFAKVLCRLRVAAAKEGVPAVLRTVLEETGMEK